MSKRINQYAIALSNQKSGVGKPMLPRETGDCRASTDPLTPDELKLVRRLLMHAHEECMTPLCEEEYHMLSKILDKLYEGGSVWGRE